MEMIVHDVNSVILLAIRSFDVYIRSSKIANILEYMIEAPCESKNNI